MSIAIMQFLKLYCNYAGGTFNYSMLADLSVAIMHVTVSVAIIQLEISAAIMQVIVSASNMWVKILFVFMQVGFPVVIMQVVLSAVHNWFYCKMQVTVPVIAMQVTLSSNSFVFLSLTGTTFHKLDRKHLKLLYQVGILPLL